jgi:hypothetical protein
MPPTTPQPLHALAAAIAAAFRADAAAELRLGGPEAVLRAMVLEALARLVDTLALMLRDWEEGRLTPVSHLPRAPRHPSGRATASKDSTHRYREGKASTPGPLRPCPPSLCVLALKNRAHRRSPAWPPARPGHGKQGAGATPFAPCLPSLGAFAVKDSAPRNGHLPWRHPHAKTAGNAGRLRTSILLRNRTKHASSAAAAPSRAPQPAPHPAPHRG